MIRKYIIRHFVLFFPSSSKKCFTFQSHQHFVLNTVLGGFPKRLISSYYPPLNLKVLFFGTDSYSLEHLKFLDVSRNTSLISDLQVVVPNLLCSVGQYVKSRNITYHIWPLKDISSFDVGVVVSFGHLIPKRIINCCSNGILNVHPSLLPRWRGAAPIPHSILAGDKETGVSIMEISANKFDVGPLLVQHKVAMPDYCTSTRLAELLAPVGARLLLKVLANLSEYHKKRQPQPASVDDVYASKFMPESTFINWEQQTADEVNRQYRALGDLHGLRTDWKNHKVRLLDGLSSAEMMEPTFAADLFKTRERRKLLSDQTELPGAALFLWHKSALCIRCKDDWVAFRRVVIKRPMSAKDFYNGYMSSPEDHFKCFVSHQNGLDKFFLLKTYTLNS